jgi:hypothetical protein
MTAPKVGVKPGCSKELLLLDEAALGAAMLESARLWVKGQSSEALQILDEWIARPEQENEINWVDNLCGQASMTAGEMDDPWLVRQYCEKVLSHDGETHLTKAMAHYRLANILFRHSEIALARQHAARSCKLVAHQTSDEDRGLLQLLVKGVARSR